MLETLTTVFSLLDGGAWGLTVMINARFGVGFGSLFCLLLAVYPWDITGHSPFERPQDRIGAAPHLIYPGYPVGAGKSTGTLLTKAILCPTGEKTKRTPK